MGQQNINLDYCDRLSFSFVHRVRRPSDSNGGKLRDGQMADHLSHLFRFVWRCRFGMRTAGEEKAKKKKKKKKNLFS
jgi:hypothetical protein